MPSTTHQKQPPVVDGETSKRKSFLRRLSFSKSANGTSSTFLPDPSSPPVPTRPPNAPTKNRSVTAPVSYRGPAPIGGQPYEQIQPRAAPPPSRRVSQGVEAQVPTRPMARLEVRDNPPLQGGRGAGSPPHQWQAPPRSPPHQWSGPPRSPPQRPTPPRSPPVQRQPSTRSPPQRQPSQQSSPQRQPSQQSPPHRQPIRPALASPPTSPPQLGNASSPYDATMRQGTLSPPLNFGPGLPSQPTPSPSRPSRPARSSSHRVAPIDPTKPSPFARANPPAVPLPVPSRAAPVPVASPPIASPPRAYAPASAMAHPSIHPPPQQSIPPPAHPPAHASSPPSSMPMLGPNVSEASAYALAHRVPSTRKPSTSPPAMERRVSRPLPRPPSIIGKSSSGADMVLLSSSPSRQSLSAKPPSFPVIDFPRSPTLPQLVDPRNRSPMSPLSPSPSQTFRKAARRPRKLTLAYLLAQPRVQTRLLPVLPVNSFLSLVGTSPNIRKAFTGEAVGRWVTREWGIKVDSVRGRSWPNLTVWEGFLEALLHDPATYHTYPPKWHSLLQHLCLSYTLVVLHLRNLPSACFPDMPLDEEPSEAVAPAEPTIAGLSRMARHERLVELVMPSPLSSAPPAELTPDPSLRRRGSMASMSSAASFSFPRKRANSLLPSSASIKPPPAYPTPKRYGFKSGDGTKSRTSSESGRPGSVFSYQSSPSMRPSVQFRQKNLLRASFASSDPGRLSPKPVLPTRVEPIFDQPPPYTLGRAPVLRVFVPLSERVPRWPSAEGALWTVKELDKCGATKRLKLGDLVINTAIRPKGTEHILMFVPFIKHLLVPLEYTQNKMGHLPSYVDAFTLPPSYYHPLLSPIILFLDLGPFVIQAMTALRLAYDRRDVTVSSGARVTAKRYIHVTGFEIQPTEGIAPEWQGIVSLEAEGTVEGKAEMERRLGNGDPRQAVKGPWEIVREKSMRGNTWLRLVHTT